MLMARSNHQCSRFRIAAGIAQRVVRLGYVQEAKMPHQSTAGAIISRRCHWGLPLCTTEPRSMTLAAKYLLPLAPVWLR